MNIEIYTDENVRENYFKSCNIYNLNKMEEKNDIRRS